MTKVKNMLKNIHIQKEITANIFGGVEYFVSKQAKCIK